MQLGIERPCRCIQDGQESTQEPVGFDHEMFCAFLTTPTSNTAQIRLHGRLSRPNLGSIGEVPTITGPKIDPNSMANTKGHPERTTSL